MSGGVVTGGWNFVIAAYVVTFSMLFIYGVSVITRLREECFCYGEGEHRE